MTTTMSNRYWDGDTERMAPVGYQVRSTVPPRPVTPEPRVPATGLGDRTHGEPGQGHGAGYGAGVGSGYGTGFDAGHGPGYDVVRPDGRYGYDGASAVVSPAAQAEPVEHRPVVDATRLWSGGLATAVVAALIGLVGVLVVRVAFHVALYAPTGAAALGSSASVTMLCLVAAGAALAATGLAHLLLLSTPRPLAYLGWIVGLTTAVAVVIPFLGSTSLAVTGAAAVIHLVIGLAIGTLVAGSAAAATRSGRLR